MAPFLFTIQSRVTGEVGRWAHVIIYRTWIAQETPPQSLEYEYLNCQLDTDTQYPGFAL